MGKKNRKSSNNDKKKKNVNRQQQDSSSKVNALLEELKSKTRTLLASITGVSPDGAAFATPTHPLAELHASIFHLTRELMKEQTTKLQTKEYSLDQTAPTPNRNNNYGGSSTTSMDSSSPRDDPEIWQRFDEWLLASGIEVDRKDEFPVEIRRTDHGYGLVATRDIMYGEKVVEIPVNAMMCPYWTHAMCDENTAASSSSTTGTGISEGNDAQQQQHHESALIQYLCSECLAGDKSAFKPYLDTLPRSYSTPLYWTVEGIRQLRQTQHLKRAVFLQVMSIWEYLELRQLPSMSTLTYETFRWAKVTAHTRQNPIPHVVNGKVRDVLALVPLWDMMNHEDSNRACRSEVELYEDDKQQGMLICRTPAGDDENNDNSMICFRKGEEVTMYYGDRSNAQLLFHSGFVNCSFVTSNHKDGQQERIIENKNRTDHSLLRLALPPVECDAELYRLREMVAARMGFRAYVDQFCTHDGIELSNIAVNFLSSTTTTTSPPGTTLPSPSTGSGRDGAVLMSEFPVSPDKGCTVELCNALKLCIANKEELGDILRQSSGTVEPNSPKLSKWQGEFLAALVHAHEHKAKDKPEEGHNISNSAVTTGPSTWTSIANSQKLSRLLAHCDNHTLQRWYEHTLNKKEK